MSTSISNTLGDWAIDIWIKPVIDNDFSRLYTGFVISRAPTQKFFSLFIILIMWIMSLGVFSMSLAHLWYSRKVEAPTIGVVTTMLFALPAVRNTQPGAPPIGCTSDVVGFFWNMGLVASGAMILLYRFSFQESKPYVPLQRGMTRFSSSMWNLKPSQSGMSMKSEQPADPSSSVQRLTVPLRDAQESGSYRERPEIFQSSINFMQEPSFGNTSSTNEKRLKVPSRERLGIYDTFTKPSGGPSVPLNKSSSDFIPTALSASRKVAQFSRSVIAIPQDYGEESTRLLPRNKQDVTSSQSTEFVSSRENNTKDNPKETK
jgi:hypothetical protein